MHKKFKEMINSSLAAVLLDRALQEEPKMVLVK
jgi:hypothetical protein